MGDVDLYIAERRGSDAIMWLLGSKTTGKSLEECDLPCKRARVRQNILADGWRREG
jgi:hypothetical protein